METENTINQIEDTDLDKPKTEVIYDPLAVDWDKFSKDKELWSVFFNQFQVLSEPLKNVLLDLETQIVLRNIQAQFQLQDNQIASLSRLVRQMVIAQIY